jgi:hypothetical protein
MRTPPTLAGNCRCRKNERPNARYNMVNNRIHCEYLIGMGEDYVRRLIGLGTGTEPEKWSS